MPLEHRAYGHSRLELIARRGGLHGDSKTDSRLHDFIVECFQTYRIAADDREVARQLIMYKRS